MKLLDKKKPKELDRTTEISIGELNKNKLVDEITSKELSKPKELDFNDKLYDIWFESLCNGNYQMFQKKIKEMFIQQRTELLEEIKDLQTYVLFNDTEKLISLEQVINLLNKKDETN